MRLRCLRCGDATDHVGPDAVGRCDCGGVLSPSDADETGDDGLWSPAVERVVARDNLLDVAGATPTRALPATADAVGVDALHVKDEGATPTGSVRDRGAAAAVAAAHAGGHEAVATAAAGDGGVAVAAYAARAGLDAAVYLPSRARFDAKAAVNVHGADMTVVRGRLGDAREAAADADGCDCSPFASPWYHDALGGVGAELLDGGDPERGRPIPDHVVLPVADGGLYVGLDAVLPDGIGLHAVQPAGCAPVVETAGSDAVAEPEDVAVDAPDTVVGELEDPAPPAGPEAVAALRRRGGGAVAVEDGAVLDRGVDVARCDGRLPSLAGAAALEGCARLADRFDADDAVTVVDPGFGRLDVDGFRSRLMGRGE